MKIPQARARLRQRPRPWRSSCRATSRSSASKVDAWMTRSRCRIYHRTASARDGNVVDSRCTPSRRDAGGVVGKIFALDARHHKTADHARHCIDDWGQPQRHRVSPVDRKSRASDTCRGLSTAALLLFCSIRRARFALDQIFAARRAYFTDKSPRSLS